MAVVVHTRDGVLHTLPTTGPTQKAASAFNSCEHQLLVRMAPAGGAQLRDCRLMVQNRTRYTFSARNMPKEGELAPRTSASEDRIVSSAINALTPFVKQATVAGVSGWYVRILLGCFPHSLSTLTPHHTALRSHNPFQEARFLTLSMRYCFIGVLVTQPSRSVSLLQRSQVSASLHCRPVRLASYLLHL